MVRFVRFSYYKTANYTAPYGAVHYYLRCGAVMPFCEWFWCGLCDLCGLVNTPNSYDPIMINVFIIWTYIWLHITNILLAVLAAGRSGIYCEDKKFLMLLFFI